MFSLRRGHDLEEMGILNGCDADVRVKPRRGRLKRRALANLGKKVREKTSARAIIEIGLGLLILVSRRDSGGSRKGNIHHVEIECKK